MKKTLENILFGGGIGLVASFASAGFVGTWNAYEASGYKTIVETMDVDWAMNNAPMLIGSGLVLGGLYSLYEKYKSKE